MSSSVIPDHETYDRRVPPASRLIPGLPFPQAGSARKKPQSVTWDRRYWIDEEAEHLQVPQSPDTAAAMRRAIFPTPAEGGDRYRLVTQVGADFLLTALNLTLLFSIVEARIGAAWTVPLPRLCTAFIYGALLTLLGYSEGLYRSDTKRETECVILGKVVAWATLLAAGAFCGSGLRTMGVLAVGAPMTYFTLLSWRGWQQREAGACEGLRSVRNVLIVGAGKSGRDLAARLGSDRSRQRVVCGFLDDEEPAAGDILGGIRDLARVARTEFVDEVILAGDSQRDVARRVIGEARRNRLDVRFVPDLFGLESPSVVLERFGDTPVLTLHEEPIPVVGLLAKRALDILLSATALALVAPLLWAIALAIKLDSPGPVFYRALRVGRKGRHFLCCKFRTMSTDAESRKEQLRGQNEREGAFFKITDDPRITRFGRFLRRYSLDELPQLFNVLQGEMSMVGPRPHPVDDCERYRLQDLRRLDVTPGITGLWQVTARRDPSFDRNMALDLEYIERWNLWMDLKILCRTAWVVVQGSGD
jgi:exopolysaccharide biosynthesis polyprenyl glycosylphosphotransferase